MKLFGNGPYGPNPYEMILWNDLELYAAPGEKENAL